MYHNYFHLLLLYNLVCSHCKLATPSAARLLLYSFVQRNVNVQDDTAQYLERAWIHQMLKTKKYLFLFFIYR
ncbi:hypothetical protein T06_3144 [Trichinella sp. T6]|nr:hypothetical protein T06_3144 [Trichinella sp. T6]